MFSGSLRDDRAQNGLASLICCRERAENVNTDTRTPDKKEENYLQNFIYTSHSDIPLDVSVSEFGTRLQREPFSR